MKNEQIVGLIKQLSDNGYPCPYSTDIAQIPQLLEEIRKTNERSEKVYMKVFEDNGESLVSQVRINRNDINDLKSMQKQTFDAVKSMKPNNGKKFMGIPPEIYNKLWLYFIRIIVAGLGLNGLTEIIKNVPK